MLNCLDVTRSKEKTKEKSVRPCKGETGLNQLRMDFCLAASAFYGCSGT